MADPHRPSMATGEGQALAFVEALGSLRGRRRVVARVVTAAVLVAGSGGLAVLAVRAFTGAFT